MTILYILLAVIAYYLYRIYRQKEDEKGAITDEKWEAEREQQEKEKFKDYPHIYGKLESNWLEVFHETAVEKGIPLLRIMFYLMVGESTKIDYSEGSVKYDSLWDVTKELLEHLEKYHEGSITEHEIALTTYWQITAMEMERLLKEKPNTKSLSSPDAHTAEIEGEKLEKAPFTDIEKIASLFPKKTNHPAHEITFFNKDGSFPRESKGSDVIEKRIEAFGGI